VTRASDRRLTAAFVTVGVGFALCYWSVLTKLVHDWWTDDNYSHGFLIVPLAAYLVWERRDRFAATPDMPTPFGLVVVLGSLCVLIAGILGAELFLTRISIIGTVVGVVLFQWGWPRLKVLAFPLAFLLLMIPLPAIIFNQISVPLQIVASRVGEFILNTSDVPVLREGNVLVLPNTTLEVAEACSGIRSLISLLTLAIIVSYFGDRRTWVRIVLPLMTVPVAILANGMRVAGIGVVAYRFGAAAARGFLHEFSGFVLFSVALIMIYGIYRLLLMLRPPHTTVTPSPAASLS
jgi:exosortase